jgi:hypothetical protein
LNRWKRDALETILLNRVSRVAPCSQKAKRPFNERPLLSDFIII